VAAAYIAPRFDALHLVAFIKVVANNILGYWLRKAGPARHTVVLGGRVEQQLPQPAQA
jgi:hypothetical protein